MEGIVDILFTVDFAFSIIRVSTPLIFAALAALVTKKAGITNLGIEGIMLISALAGVVFSAISQSAVVGLIGAMVAGVLVAAMMAFFTLRMQTDIYLTSIATNMLASGGTVFTLFLICGDKGVSTSLKSMTMPIINIPLLKDVPVIGEILSGHNLLTYVAMLAVVIMYFLMYRTATGLRIRSVGENEHAAESVGISIQKIRFISLLISGLFASLGGAYLSMGYVSWFARDMVAGRGFIGISAMNLGNASPVGALLASLVFAFAEALSMAMQSLKVPVEFVQMMPYVITIIGLVLFAVIRNRHEKKIKRSR